MAALGTAFIAADSSVFVGTAYAPDMWMNYGSAVVAIGNDSGSVNYPDWGILYPLPTIVG
jgi:hypothetical protein